MSERRGDFAKFDRVVDASRYTESYDVGGLESRCQSELCEWRYCGPGRESKFRLRSVCCRSLDVGHENHLVPLLGLVGDEFAEISGRACNHSAS
jgi:hypothetical protein